MVHLWIEFKCQFFLYHEKVIQRDNLRFSLLYLIYGINISPLLIHLIRFRRNVEHWYMGITPWSHGKIGNIGQQLFSHKMRNDLLCLKPLTIILFSRIQFDWVQFLTLLKSNNSIWKVKSYIHHLLIYWKLKKGYSRAWPIIWYPTTLKYIKKP